MPLFTTSLTDPALIALLQQGTVGILLTDTVYGIVGSARSSRSAASVIDAKGRKYKPGTLIAANSDQLVELGVQREHIAAAERYWPGAVSVVLPAGVELEYMHVGKMSLPMRVPDKPDLLQLLEMVGPLVTTSANRPNEPMVKSIKEAQEIFGDKVQFYVDGGELANPVASTIVKIDEGKVVVLRQGAVTIDGLI